MPARGGGAEGCMFSSLNSDLYFTDLYRPYSMKDGAGRPLTAIILHLDIWKLDGWSLCILVQCSQEMCTGSILHPWKILKASWDTYCCRTWFAAVSNKARGKQKWEKQWHLGIRIVSKWTMLQVLSTKRTVFLKKFIGKLGLFGLWNLVRQPPPGSHCQAPVRVEPPSYPGLSRTGVMTALRVWHLCFGNTSEFYFQIWFLHFMMFYVIVFVCMHVYMYIYIYIYMHTYMYVWLYVCIFMRLSSIMYSTSLVYKEWRTSNLVLVLMHFPFWTAARSLAFVNLLPEILLTIISTYKSFTSGWKDKPLKSCFQW